MINTNTNDVVSLSVDYDFERCLAIISLSVLNDDLVGNRAHLEFYTRYSKHEKIFEDTVTESLIEIDLLSRINQITLPIDELELLPYSGEFIQLDVGWKVGVDGIGVFEGWLDVDDLGLSKKESVGNNPADIVEPKDHYSILSNYFAITLSSRSVAAITTICILILVSGLLWLGWHDQGVSNSETLIFDHGDSHRRSARLLNHPLAQALCVVIIAIIVYLSLIRNILKRYMSFRVDSWPETPRRRDVLLLKEYVSGTPILTLRNFKFRIVAANYERVVYFSLEQRRHREIKVPVRAVVLYEKDIPLLRAGQDISEVLGEDAVALSPMFSGLYPPKYAGMNGLFVHWEAQLIHHDYLDHKEIGPDNTFVFSDFY